MADEQKPVQKPPIETPKDIEDLLKDLPKINTPKFSPAPQTPPLPKTPESMPKPPLLYPPSQSSPSFKPLFPEPLRQPTPPPSSPLSKTDNTAKPSIPAPFPPSVAQDKFKPLVRTMNEDLELAKKGIKSEPKPFEIKSPPTSSKPIPAPLPPKPLLPSEIKLGPTQRTKALELPKAAAPFTDVSKPKKFFIGKIIIIVLGIAVVFAGAWYFLIQQKETTIVIPTLTPTLTPAPTPKNLSELIPLSSQITISSTENFLTALISAIKSQTLTNGGLLTLNIADENGTKYSLDQIFQRLNIALPNGLMENLNSEEWILAVYGQQEIYDSKGMLSFNQASRPKLVLIAKTDYPSALRSALNEWEITVTDGFKNVFEINPQKAFTQTFQDNIYSETGIRYKNFSYPDSSIDYAILNLPDLNSNYLILTSSRESIYSAINLLQNQ